MTDGKLPQKDLDLSKAITYILRHKPHAFGIKLNREGYCAVTLLTIALNTQEKYSYVTEEDVLRIVETCPKQRFEVSGKLIRARYGHSAMRVPRTPSEPPHMLYHGTVTSALVCIKKEGILEMNREDVHLVVDEAKQFSIEAAGRKLRNEKEKRVYLLPVNTAKAQMLGVNFYDTGHGTWLSEAIPPEAIEWEDTIELDYTGGGQYNGYEIVNERVRT